MITVLKQNIVNKNESGYQKPKMRVKSIEVNKKERKLTRLHWSSSNDSATSDVNLFDDVSDNKNFPDCKLIVRNIYMRLYYFSVM
jgi:hypothetical protein